MAGTLALNVGRMKYINGRSLSEGESDFYTWFIFMNNY